jgi:outer membrane protein with beta-barrel domain
MSDNSMHDLDKLFRQGAEQHGFEYNPEAWGQMEILLEKDRRRKLLWWWLVGAGTLALVVFLYVYQGPNKVIENTLADNNTVDRTELQTDLNHDVAKQRNFNPLAETDKKSSPLQGKNKEIGETNISAKLDQIAPTESSAPASFKDRPIAEEPTLEFNTRSEVDDNSTVTPVLTPPDFEQSEYANQNDPERISGRRDILSGTRVKLRNDLDVNYISGLTLEYLPIDWFDIAQARRAAFDNATLAQVDKTKTKGALYIGAILSGELTSIGPNDFAHANFSYGGHVEYRFKKFFGVSLGANFIKKNYEAGTGEYVPPKGFWTRKIPPEYTVGETSILEVPLLFGYYHKGYQKSGFYTQLGLTSYFLLKERYQYFYELPDPDLIRAWGTDNENQYWFGIGQVSAGYNHYVSPRWSFQIAPYLQIPLTGIGHGNLKMWTAGIQLKVNFRAL